MGLSRRFFLHSASAAAALSVCWRRAAAQNYPARPITMIVPFPAGGANDVVARIIAERMRQDLGQRLVIENVGGADGSVGVGRLARARPDGYTICLGIDGAFVLNGAFYSLPYDLLNDFAPIAPLVTGPILLLARTTLPAQDLKELVAWLKAHPGEGSAGMNTLGFHLLAARFQLETQTQFTIVPYRAAGAVVQDLVAGRIDLAFATMTTHLPMVRNGSEKAIAVASEARSALAPEIPTFAEMGLPTLTYANWYGLFAPKGTPAEIVGKLNAAAVAALADPAVKARLIDVAVEVISREEETPQALAAMQKADAEKWWPIVKELGLKAE
jgi:tripartite-type tricarboxylate transporter receptor subunit TctC